MPSYLWFLLKSADRFLILLAADLHLPFAAAVVLSISDSDTSDINKEEQVKEKESITDGQLDMFSANSEEKHKKEEVKKDYKIISDTSMLYSEIQKKGICSVKQRIFYVKKRMFYVNKCIFYVNKQ